MSDVHLSGRTEGVLSVEALRKARIHLDEHPAHPTFRLAPEPPDEWLLLELSSLGASDDNDDARESARSLYQLIKSLVHPDDWDGFAKAMREVPRSLPVMGPNPKHGDDPEQPEEIEVSRVAVSKNAILIGLLRSIIPLYTARPT